MDRLQETLIEYDIVPDNLSYKVALSLSISNRKYPSITLMNGQVVTPRQLLFEVLAVDPQHSTALNNLGSLLATNETVVLPDGREMDERALFLEALKFNYENNQALFNLSLGMQHNEVVQLPTGDRWNQKQIYKHLLATVNTPDAYVCSQLAWVMDDDESVKVCGVERIGKMAMFLFRFHLGNVRPTDYVGLVQCLDRYGEDETICLKEGEVATARSLTGRTLTLEAMRRFPENSLVYFQMAVLLRPNEAIILPSGALVDSKELLIMGLNSGVHISKVHSCGPHISKDRSRGDYTDMDEFSAYKKACVLRDDYTFALYCLQKRLDVGESITLNDGTVVSASVKRIRCCE